MGGDGLTAARKRRDAVQTKRRLLEAAQVEFAAYGYQGARLKAIARHAGVQPALIHHYFEGKAGLYHAMLDGSLEESSTLSFDILHAESPTFEDIVNGFARMLLRYHRDNDNLISILRHEGKSRDPAASEVTRAVMEDRAKPVVDAVTAFIEAQQALGAVRRDIAPGELILMMLSLTSYPFIEPVFLETCLPDGLVRDDAELERRAQIIAETVMRAADPTAES